MARRDRLYMGTNTKMYQKIQDAVSFVKQLEACTSELSRELLQLFVIPPYTAIEHAVKAVSEHSLMIGAQNMCWEERGQYTGEISPLMLDEIGARLIMAGHSERRHIFGETDEEENKKIKSALNHGFTALLCIGETMEQKDCGISDEILRIQVKRGLLNIDNTEAENLWIAYEPVWAIGVNGIPASEAYAEEKHQVIRRVLCEIFGDDVGGDIPILYGGSVNAENAEKLIQMPSIDGLFIGRSAWEAESFQKIIKSVLPLFLEKKKLDEIKRKRS